MFLSQIMGQMLTSYSIAPYRIDGYYISFSTVHKIMETLEIPRPYDYVDSARIRYQLLTLREQAKINPRMILVSSFKMRTWLYDKSRETKEGEKDEAKVKEVVDMRRVQSPRHSGGLRWWMTRLRMTTIIKSRRDPADFLEEKREELRQKQLCKPMILTTWARIGWVQFTVMLAYEWTRLSSLTDSLQKRPINPRQTAQYQTHSMRGQNLGSRTPGSSDIIRYTISEFSLYALTLISLRPLWTSGTSDLKKAEKKNMAPYSLSVEIPRRRGLLIALLFS
ncbi:hypothetical protein EDD18DRAFT_1335786 [Armillaria luteobubalina]|uniref:Uncharacterized protein n=1 Tax=Armillaria luteobubalina TaxID=153913 RepID=A0AA39UDV7_9AGAR|nr:hypothetical protein EDD18DRAFT_1335786 [Armillaria luteobubalina]